MSKIMIGTVVFPLLIMAGAAHTEQAITLFGATVPAIADVADDTSPVTLGVKFYSTQSGTVSGIRFYRGATNANGYTVKLFSVNGSRLATGRATSDTCSVPCWEQINFAAPISITANTVYIAAYYTSNGNYADDENGLTNGATNGPLNAQASVPNGAPGGNGVYTYSTGFPNQTWHDSNYYVDVVFATNAPILMMSFSPPNPSVQSDISVGSVVAAVNVSWSDGSPFTGTLGFAAPYNNDSGAFALSGNNVVVSNVANDGNTVQNITVIATQ